MQRIRLLLALLLCLQWNGFAQGVAVSCTPKNHLIVSKAGKAIYETPWRAWKIKDPAILSLSLVVDTLSWELYNWEKGTLRKGRTLVPPFYLPPREEGETFLNDVDFSLAENMGFFYADERPPLFEFTLGDGSQARYVYGENATLGRCFGSSNSYLLWETGQSELLYRKLPVGEIRTLISTIPRHAVGGGCCFLDDSTVALLGHPIRILHLPSEHVTQLNQKDGMQFLPRSQSQPSYGDSLFLFSSGPDEREQMTVMNIYDWKREIFYPDVATIAGFAEEVSVIGDSLLSVQSGFFSGNNGPRNTLFRLKDMRQVSSEEYTARDTVRVR